MTGWRVSLSMTVPLAVIGLGRRARNTAAATAAVTTSASGMIRVGRRYHALRAAAGGEGGGPGWSGGPAVSDLRTIPLGLPPPQAPTAVAGGSRGRLTAGPTQSASGPY